jgi:hypothetical protein
MVSSDIRYLGDMFCVYYLTHFGGSVKWYVLNMLSDSVEYKYVFIQLRQSLCTRVHTHACACTHTHTHFG